VTVPSKDRGELIREHGERLATLNERIDNLRRDIDRIQNALESRTERRWSLYLALVGLLGAVIGGLLNEAVKVLLPKPFR
jgi:hypothetical protein